ncbi:MAG: chitobiase/beta-hexosaminidase C-terminal domain-containing protein [Marinilabiliaceae bacterium]|nr:chitobiase/beta-hexosaminidase C-terminal domain-containing protein [Marinilabiliaceae bacterium]
MTVLMKNPLKKGLLIIVLVTMHCFVFAADSGKIIINEVMAINNTTLADKDGEYSDWIELYNPGASAVNLSGWYLTDNPDNLPKWQFPGITIAAGGYLIIFASEKNYTDPLSELHTNFKLSGSGEYLSLLEPDGVTFSSSFGTGIPYQQADVSYGLYNSQYVYLTQPTPGLQNLSGSNIFLPKFSHERGFYDAQFSLTLSSVEAGYDIYYTTNGSIPTKSNGTKYSSPITISKTSVVSAVCINKSTSAVGPMGCNTYLFIDDILTQPNDPAGYPNKFSSTYPADYEMDPEICTTGNKTKLVEALKSIPSVSFVTSIDNLFSSSTDPYTGGIYYNSEKTTDEWERPASIEYIDITTGQSFQLNCGLRVHGGNSRKPGNSPKHGFRASFRSNYGPSKLNFNVFDEKSATNEFNNLVFRAGYNYSWIKNAPVQCDGADYLKDPFAKNTQLDMDRVAAHNKFVHLYINGLYWGLYNISEKLNNDFMEAYMGGNEEDYDVVNDDGINAVTDGTWTAWKSLLDATSAGYSSIANYEKVQGRNADGSINTSYSNLLDVRNFIDYMIINYYMGNKDWDKNNWFAGRNRVTNEYGFRFYCWDTETSLLDLNENLLSMNNSSNPTGIHNKLKASDEYKLYFADRIQKHLFNGGALTPTSATDRYMKMATKIEKAIWGESARWGDYRRDVEPNMYSSSDYELYNPDEHWTPNVNYMQNTYFPQRTDIVLEQFKNAGLFPDIDAPTFSHYGGDITESVSVSISSTEGTIYYTTNDSDPRLIGGSIAVGTSSEYSQPLIITQDTVIKARVKSGSDWSPIVRVKFDCKNGGTISVQQQIYVSNSVIESSAYPNPFSVSTTIAWYQPEEGPVTVSIVNIDGRVIDELYYGTQNAGRNFVEWAPVNVTEGIYFYQIQYNSKIISDKILYKP